jgi:hypothetical protein
LSPKFRGRWQQIGDELRSVGSHRRGGPHGRHPGTQRKLPCPVPLPEQAHAFTLGRVDPARPKRRPPTSTSCSCASDSGSSPFRGVDIVTLVQHAGPPRRAGCPPPSGRGADLGPCAIATRTHGNGTGGRPPSTASGSTSGTSSDSGGAVPVQDLELGDLQRHVDRHARARGTRAGGSARPQSRKRSLRSGGARWPVQSEDGRQAALPYPG